MISRILETIYPPFNLRICLRDFLYGFFPNLPGSYPVASSKQLAGASPEHQEASMNPPKGLGFVFICWPLDSYRACRSFRLVFKKF